MMKLLEWIIIACPPFYCNFFTSLTPRAISQTNDDYTPSKSSHEQQKRIVAHLSDDMKDVSQLYHDNVRFNLIQYFRVEPK
jgi:hypothetical protein